MKFFYYTIIIIIFRKNNILKFDFSGNKIQLKDVKNVAQLINLNSKNYGFEFK